MSKAMKAGGYAARAGWLALACMVWVGNAAAQPATLADLLAQGERYEQRGELHEALKAYLAANQVAPTNAEVLCRITRQYCDLMHETKARSAQKELARAALDYAKRAVLADPESARAHLCVAVSCVKNFPFIDNQTKVDYSKLVKAEAEKAIALDPQQDISYYMLGRWHFEVANMGIITRGLIRIAYGGLPQASNQLAADNFKKAIALAPNRIIHHFELSKAYHALGQDKLAVEELKKCRALTPVDRDDQQAREDAEKELKQKSS